MAYLLTANTAYSVSYNAFMAARLFDPRHIKSLDKERIQLLINGLQHFKYPEFTDAWLALVANEIDAYKELCQKDFDWDSLEGAKEYNEILRRKLERKPAASVESIEDSDQLQMQEPSRFDQEVPQKWQDDCSEVARCIWEWWRLHGDKFVYLTRAAELVALFATSSASVERIFSQFKLIYSQIGVLAYKITWSFAA